VFLSMSKFDPSVTLQQTIDFIKEAQGLVAGISFEQLLADSIKLRAFEQRTGAVGGKLTTDFPDGHG